MDWYETFCTTNISGTNATRRKERTGQSKTAQKLQKNCSSKSCHTECEGRPLGMSCYKKTCGAFQARCLPPLTKVLFFLQLVYFSWLCFFTMKTYTKHCATPSEMRVWWGMTPSAFPSVQYVKNDRDITVPTSVRDIDITISPLSVEANYTLFPLRFASVSWLADLRSPSVFQSLE